MWLLFIISAIGSATGLQVPLELTSSRAATASALCIYTDKQDNLLRAGFDSCFACVEGCSKWVDCNNVFFDGINITRSSIYKFNCVALQAWRRGTFLEGTGQAMLRLPPSSGGNAPPLAPLPNAERDVSWFSLTEKVITGRQSNTLIAGVTGPFSDGTEKTLVACLLESVPNGWKEKDPDVCIGHIGYTWEGSGYCYVNAVGRACVLPADTDKTLYFQNHSMLAWLPHTSPSDNLAIGWKVQRGDKQPLRSVVCRGRYAGGVYVGGLVFSGHAPTVDEYRCYVYYQGNVVTLAGFEVLGIKQEPIAMGKECSSECGGQLNQTFPSSITMVDGTHLLATSAEACCALCRSTLGCAAWVFNLQGSNQCTLKWKIMEGEVWKKECTADTATNEIQSIGGVVPKPVVLEQILGDCRVRQGFIEDRRYDAKPGSTIRTHAATFGDCCRQCRQRALCRAFSWNKVWQSCDMTSAPIGLLDNLMYVSARMRS